MNKFTFDTLPNEIIISQKDGFHSNCTFETSHKTLESILNKKLKIKIVKTGNIVKQINNAAIKIYAISGHIVICISDNNTNIEIGENVRGTYDLRTWRESSITIGKNTTSNGVKIICDNSNFSCGEDCMISDDVLIQTSDQHGIVDIEDQKIINSNFSEVTIGPHVWLGRKSTIMRGVNIGKGSVIGTGSIVTKDIGVNCIAAGTPALIIKENHTWSRSPLKLDYFTEMIIEDFKRK